jgi:DNA-binding MarR family transcriptional regulator
MRFRICGLLGAVQEMEFGAMRDTLGISDSALSKHLTRLESIGYVTTKKVNAERYLHTWVSLTPLGRERFAGHLAALRQIASGSL